MKTQFKRACTVCGKIGHKGVDCFTLEKNKEKKEEYFKKLKEKRNKGKNKRNWSRKPNNDGNSNNPMAMTNIDQEMILVAKNEATIFSAFTWIADSGATTHMTNKLAGMFDLMDANICISVGDGRKMTTLKVGKWKGTVIDLEGRKHEITLTNVSYVPQLMVNLFSLTAAMEKGYSVVGSKDGITLQKENWSMNFDRKIGTPRGHVFATTLIPSTNYEIAHINIPIRYEKAHEILGHPGQNKLIGTADRLGWTLAAKVEQECEDCLKGKARRLNLNKESKNKANRPGERLMIDISTIKSTKNKRVGRYWLLIVDEATDMKWSYFLRKKSNQVKVLMGFLKQLINSGYNIKFIRCDNAGENVALKQQVDNEGLNINFEFTARMTPQQNGKVERAFATLYGRMRAMMNGAKWNDEMKQAHWMEAASTATKLENILNEKGSKTPYYAFYNENPDYEANLRTFGELGIVTETPGQSIKSKLQDRGIKCMFVGYASNHAGNVYRMLNLKTKRVILSRDVRWLNTFIVTDREENETYEIEFENDDNRLNYLEGRENGPGEQQQDEEENPQENPQPEQNRNLPQPRLIRELRGLEPFNNPGRLEIEGENNQLCFFVPDTNDDDDSVPLTFQDAWYHEDPEERAKWREAIRLEFKQMLKNLVWRRKKGLNNLPPNRKGIGTKWVFKKKKNGVYRARLVAKGLNQIAGVDFQYNFAPVTSEVTLRILLIMWIVDDLFAEVADVQTAFLHGDLEEELFITIPPGYKEFLAEMGETIEEKYLKLEKSTYGLVQAARSWWKKFTKVLKHDLGFEQYENDSCLLKRKTSKGQVFLIIYVDDCFVVGDKDAVKEALEEIEKHFSITRSEKIEDFIGCRIEKDGDRILLSQPDLISKMTKKFEDKIKTMKDYATPASAGTHIVRCTTDEERLSEDEQMEFRSGVGSLLYLLKHSRPELSNSVRELSKVMDAANKAHQKSLYRAIKFVHQTKDRRLVINPKKEQTMWEIKAYSDSDFAGDTETR